MTDEDDRLFGPEHVRVYRETRGERGFHWRGGTVLLLTTRGRRTGDARTIPLLFREDGERFVIVASKGGAPEHPRWYENLVADPEASVQVRAEELPVRARTVAGDERARLWRRMAEVWPDYEAYQERTDREIPVVVLERR
jgi:deazaflavin-dependent oxidoreductase (nitroreductase family)